VRCPASYRCPCCPRRSTSTDRVARLTALLESRYDTHITGSTPFYEEAERAVYRVDRRDGLPWVVRLFPRARSLERVLGAAVVLRHVEQQGIPAERLVAAADGSLVIDLDGCGVLVTRFIPGGRLDRSIDRLRRLGEAVGLLHALPPVPDVDPFLSRRAGALPKEDLAFARACLTRIAGRVPRDLRDEYEDLRVALDATHDCEDLPHGLIHSDCHLANVLRTPGGHVVLFDWEGAGQGPRVADLGLLLYSCAIQAPYEPPGPTNLGRVDAVIDGYARCHTPSRAELDRLPDAARFRPAVIAARELAARVEQGQREDRTGWWTRYAEADAVATCAQQALERYL